MQPAEGTCQSLQSVFGKGPDEPIGIFVLLICMAASTTIHSVVHTISSVVALSIVADCICSTYNEDNTVVTCRHKMPETIDVCKTMIAQFQRVFLNMPGRPLYHIQTAMDAFIDIPPSKWNGIRESLVRRLLEEQDKVFRCYYTAKWGGQKEKGAGGEETGQMHVGGRCT